MIPTIKMVNFDVHDFPFDEGRYTRVLLHLEFPKIVDMTLRSFWVGFGDGNNVKHCGYGLKSNTDYNSKFMNFPIKPKMFRRARG
jgi:hypothetical protein